MSILDINIADVQEPKPVPDGTFLVRIMGAPEVRQSQSSGNKYINVRLEVVGEVGAADVYDTIVLPAEDASAADNERRKLRLKRFCDAFGISYENGSIDLEAAEGLESYAILSVESDQEYGDRNRVKRYVAAE